MASVATEEVVGALRLGAGTEDEAEEWWRTGHCSHLGLHHVS